MLRSCELRDERMQSDAGQSAHQLRWHRSGTPALPWRRGWPPRPPLTAWAAPGASSVHQTRRCLHAAREPLAAAIGYLILGQPVHHEQAPRMAMIRFHSLSQRVSMSRLAAGTAPRWGHILGPHRQEKKSCSARCTPALGGGVHRHACTDAAPTSCWPWSSTQGWTPAWCLS